MKTEKKKPNKSKFYLTNELSILFCSLQNIRYAFGAIGALHYAAIIKSDKHIEQQTHKLF